MISLESARALDFLISSSKLSRRTASLSELASSHTESDKSGYSKVQLYNNLNILPFVCVSKRSVWNVQLYYGR